MQTRRILHKLTVICRIGLNEHRGLVGSTAAFYSGRRMLNARSPTP